MTSGIPIWARGIGGFYGCDMDDLLQAERELQKKYKNSKK
jgi:hypothetical protein